MEKEHIKQHEKDLKHRKMLLSLNLYLEPRLRTPAKSLRKSSPPPPRSLLQVRNPLGKIFANFAKRRRKKSGNYVLKMNPKETVKHRLNMELDLQSLFGLHTVIRFVWVSAKFGTCTVVSVRHLLKLKCAHSPINLRILSSKSVPFILTTMPAPNLALLITRNRITVHVHSCIHWLKHRTPPSPFGLIYEGAIGLPR